MIRPFRAAAIAAAAFVAVFGAGYAGPSLAWALAETPALIEPEQSAVPLGEAAAPPPASAAPPVAASLPPESVEAPEPRSLAGLVEDHLAIRTYDTQHECLAGAVYFESKGEPLRGQLSVAEVILNRTRSGRFPATVCAVVKQRGQFSFVRGGRFPPIARASLAWKRAVAIAHIAREGLADGGAPRALFFHAKRVSPRWKLTRVAAVGNHIFYR